MLYVHLQRILSDGGDATNSLVVAQQNYNETKWRQRNLSVENGTKCDGTARGIVQKFNNCIFQPKLQIKGVLRQPCMLIWELCSLIKVPNVYRILTDLKQKLEQTHEVQKIQGPFKRFSGFAREDDEFWYWGILVGIYFHHTDTSKGDITGASIQFTWMLCSLSVRDNRL